MTNNSNTVNIAAVERMEKELKMRRKELEQLNEDLNKAKQVVNDEDNEYKIKNLVLCIEESKSTISECEYKLKIYQDKLIKG